MPSTELVSNLRAQLVEERDQLRAQLASMGADGGMAFDENFADSAQVAAEQGESQVLVNQLRDSLAEAERALDKLDHGKYGLCEVCGREIAELRLEAMPATRWCIDHARR